MFRLHVALALVQTPSHKAQDPHKILSVLRPLGTTVARQKDAEWAQTIAALTVKLLCTVRTWPQHH